MLVDGVDMLGGVVSREGEEVVAGKGRGRGSLLEDD
jgi:hypothetical protein